MIASSSWMVSGTTLTIRRPLVVSSQNNTKTFEIKIMRVLFWCRFETLAIDDDG